MNKSDLKRRVNPDELGPRLCNWPAVGKVLITMIILMMTLGLVGAVGQIIIHDIIPLRLDCSFYSPISTPMVPNDQRFDTPPVLSDHLLKPMLMHIPKSKEPRAIRWGRKNSVNSYQSGYTQNTRSVQLNHKIVSFQVA